MREHGFQNSMENEAILNHISGVVDLDTIRVRRSPLESMAPKKTMRSGEKQQSRKVKLIKSALKNAAIR